MIGLDDVATSALVLLQEAILMIEPHKVHLKPGMMLLFTTSEWFTCERHMETCVSTEETKSSIEPTFLEN
jgi:hypothetical protein